YPAAGVVLILISIWIGAPASSPAGEVVEGEGPAIEEVAAIINDRCVTCHSREPSHPSFAAAPAGVAYDSETSILNGAAQIRQVVASNYM
ncbi:hypothetical protein, partial [Bacillus cereus group sp. Bc237]